MITLFQRFRDFAPVQQSMFLWERADAGVDDLIAIGRELHDWRPRRAAARTSRSSASTASTRRWAAWRTRSRPRWARRSAPRSRCCSPGCSRSRAILLVAGIMISQRFVAQNEHLQETLRESEAQLRHLIESAPMPLADRARRRPAAALRQRARAAAVRAQRGRARRGARSPTSTSIPSIRAALPEALSRHGSVRDYEVHLKDFTGRQFWLLLSAQPIRYARRRGACSWRSPTSTTASACRTTCGARRMHDQLTGLPNRAMFLESLERAVRKARRRQGPLLGALRRPRPLQGSERHPRATRPATSCCRPCAERLVAAVRQSDLVARLGGDEFVVLVEDHGGPEEVMIVAQKILTLLERPVLHRLARGRRSPAASASRASRRTATTSRRS